MEQIIIWIILLAILYLSRRFILSKPSSAPLPPGPTGWPILGNVLDLPPNNLWEKFTEWAPTHGDIIHVNAAGTPLIVINSPDLASDILHKKGAIYSDRSTPHFLVYLVGWKDTTIFLEDGPQLREHRRMIAQTLGTKAALKRFEPAAQIHTRNFLRQLRDDPHPERMMINTYIRWLSGATILDVAYGYEARGIPDAIVDLAIGIVDDSTSNATPGSRLVDFFPWASRLPSWLPGFRFKREAMEMHSKLLEFVNKPYNFAKNQGFSEHVPKPSVVASYIQEEGISEEQESNLKWAAATMFIGGTDSSFASISAAFSYLAQHPDVQAKAQAEIDAVVGPSRLPTLSDRTQLPYVNALISEVHRYSAVAPLGIAHKARIDDIHAGNLIPKDSLVMPNIWFMTRDPRNYKDPNKFDPLRFLGDNPERDPLDFVFGFGRRICPGRFFADHNLYLAITSTLTVFDILKAIDERGAMIEPTLEYKNFSLRIPEPFPCGISIRSPQAELLLNPELM